ncbi:asparagine--tRNA ligase [Exophiala xenobiotica]|uniref:asparagine--tRNA ligase n=1 Tax=Lithohypha guttulata TaxID=1690604 RepID=A0ABR0KI55_9EURO|nr:asparagine--tRNA ligase [Lithohypha guttulata]KAK5322758.1 asparagine--tRNA ligase [Exophiala xenobiotica]
MAEPYYIDEDIGKDDDSAVGTPTAPYKTLLHAMKCHPPQSSKYMTRKGGPDGPGDYKAASDSAMKKATKLYQQHLRKQEKNADAEVKAREEEMRRLKILEDAKSVVIEEDKSLPEAKRIRLDDTEGVTLGTAEKKGTRVKVMGRVHRLRSQKDVIFITLKDGYGHMQVVFGGDLIRTYAALTLTLETSLEIKGQMRELPPKANAPLNRELHADFFRVIGAAAGDKEAITNKVQAGGDPQTLLDQRHLVLRGDVLSSVMKVRAAVLRAFRQAYVETRCLEVAPPSMVQTQVEGGATLFGFKYYDEEAYLTQSSQLYLETCLPSMGDVFCICPSFRAEKSLTRRHLSEYMHVEAELDFIEFDDLLNHLETVICRVIELVLQDPVIASYVKELNPDFKPPSNPFKRIKYADAIEWLNEHKIDFDDEDVPEDHPERKRPHRFGDDIAEAAERQMTDILNVPIFLTHFPLEIKAFYMPKDPSDPRVAQAVDLLMPGVGEIVGGSMRIWDYEELIAAYHRVGIDPAPYYWYTDQRKYGTSPHGGYGLGLERFLAWLCGRFTVRECVLYPRFTNRCTP